MKWEYLPVHILIDDTAMKEALDALGLKEWEPAFPDSINQRVFLKRPLREPQS